MFPGKPAGYSLEKVSAWPHMYAISNKTAFIITFALLVEFVLMIRGDYLRCCKICYPLCAFVILAACVMACVGLVWMQVALKEDLDALKEKFRTSKWSPFSMCNCGLFQVVGQIEPQ